MRRLIARTAIAAAVVAAPAVSVPAATAASDFHVYGEAYIGCYGCGTYGPAGNYAWFTITGVLQNQVGTFNGTATFTVNQPTGAACVVSGSAQGTLHITGPNVDVDAAFTWTRVLTTAVVSVPGVGVVSLQVFVVEPVGNPCGGPVRIVFSGGGSGA